jgi:hypothetical protein
MLWGRALVWVARSGQRVGVGDAGGKRPPLRDSRDLVPPTSVENP